MKLPSRLASIREAIAANPPVIPLLVFILGAGGLLVLASVIKFSHHSTDAEKPAIPSTVITAQSPSSKLKLQPSQRQPITLRGRNSPNQQQKLAGDELRTVATTGTGDEEGEREGGERRGDWFYFQRAYPAKTIPREAPLRMREQLDREELRLKQSRASFSRAAEPEQQAVWAALGPAPIAAGQTFSNSGAPVSGRVTAIALDPGYNGTTNQTIYVGTAQGGVWRSTDNGANWIPITDGQPSLAIGSLAIDPTNPNVIYVGTGEGNRSADSYYGLGVLKSTDGGATWTQLTGPTSTREPFQPVFVNASIGQLRIDPASPNTLFACTTIGFTWGASGGSGQAAVGQVGLWKSTNGGATWRNVAPDGTDGEFSVHDVLLDPTNHQRVFAAVRSKGLYRSTAGGEPGTWEKLAGGLPDSTSNLDNSPFRRIALAAGPPIAPSTNATIYAVYAGSDNNLLGIFRSTDGGSTWNRATSPQTAGQANYNLALAVDPVNANIIYYGTQANAVNTAGTLFRSTNGGQNWSDLSRGDGSDGLHADTHAIVISPANRNILFTGNDGGIWRTGNATENTVRWKSLNPTLNITQFQAIALHPTNPNFVIGGTQDNGTNRFTGQLSWDHIRGGDGGFTLIDQSNPQVLYHTFFNQNNSGGERAQIGPEISLNGGNTWARRGCFGCSTQQGNFNPADRVGFYAPMAAHTGFIGANGNLIYFGTHRLYRSADQGVNWGGLGASSDGFGADLTKGSGRLSAIAAHPNRANSEELVWVGASDGTVQFTTNAGAGSGTTFTNVTKAPLPNRFVTDIALEPGNSQRAVVTFSGFNTVTPATPGHVFLTTNRGQTWTDISGNLPDVPVTSAAINPNNGNIIYIGTDLGVFQTTNRGGIWERLGNGMPRVAAFMVRYHAATNTLYAATHGRGVYRLTTSRPLATVSAASFSASAIASESIVAAFGTALATRTEIASSVPLPTVLAGTRVVVRDAASVERLSPLFFVAGTQINFLIPAGTAAGAATITITSDDGTVSIGTVQVATVAPSVFTANASGRDVPAGFALRIAANGAQINEPIHRLDSAQNKFVSVPVDVSVPGNQVFLVLFGTGIRFRSALSNVTATIGGVPVSVQYAGPQGDFVGLDQINLLLPSSLAERGEVDLLLAADGKASNIVRVNIK